VEPLYVELCVELRAEPCAKPRAKLCVELRAKPRAKLCVELLQSLI